MEPEDLGASDQMLDTFAALMPMLQQYDTSLKLEPDPRASKKHRREDPALQGGNGTAGAQPQVHHMLQLLRGLTQLVIRHDQELQSLHRMDQFILFLNREPRLGHSAERVADVEAADGEGSNCIDLATPATLGDPSAPHFADSSWTDCGGEGDRPIVQDLSRERVDSGGQEQTQKLVLDKRPAISSAKMLQRLVELLEMMQDKELIIRFHALRAPSEQQKISAWRLQLNLRSDRPFELLHYLSRSSVWMAIGASMKQHSLQQTPMATALQGMVQKPKGQGKGKSKGRLTK